jgi:hypothetical protein
MSITTTEIIPTRPLIKNIIRPLTNNKLKYIKKQYKNSINSIKTTKIISIRFIIKNIIRS